MTKTPEDVDMLALDTLALLAASYACDYRDGPRSNIPPDSHLVYSVAYDAFLAGYEAAQQWISVKDRLPEMRPMVLAMCTDGYELAYYGMYGGGWTNTLGTEHLNVTHWHRLPTLPKEEKE